MSVSVIYVCGTYSLRTASRTLYAGGTSASPKKMLHLRFSVIIQAIFVNDNPSPPPYLRMSSFNYFWVKLKSETRDGENEAAPTFGTNA